MLSCPRLFLIAWTSVVLSPLAAEGGQSWAGVIAPEVASGVTHSSLVSPQSRVPVLKQQLRLRGGGNLPYRYHDSWSDMTVKMPIDETIKSRDINYKLTPSSLTLGLKGHEPYIEAGELWELVKPDDTVWEIDNDPKLGRIVSLVIKKAKGAKWDYLLKSEDVPPDLTVTHKCFMDIEIDGDAIGKVVFGLYGKTTPKTCENFRKLCTGEVEVDPEKHKRATAAGKPLTYKGTKFHRIIPQFMVQGGDFTKGDGTGGESIFGDRFEDENFQIKHHREGMVSMANAGADCNGAQFFITTASASHLNGKHVVFAEVLEGYDVVKKIEDVGSNSGKPSKDAVVVDCGELPIETTE